MSTSTDITFSGRRGEIVVRAWAPADPRRVVVVVHGFGEHSGRYEHVAARLLADGAAVYAPDHYGHGRSEGERALIDDPDVLVDDLAAVVALAREEHGGLPLAMLGHSLGGVISTRYVQRGSHGLYALVLSGPVIGGNPGFEMLLQLEEIPDVPIDPEVLSRDPAVGRAYAADELVYHGPLRRESLEGLVSVVGAIAAGPTFGALPTLWIHGSDDFLAPVASTRPVIERLAAEAAGGLEEHVYEGAKHEILNETNREEVLDTVADFLDRTQAAAG